MFKRILIANRGEVALRIQRACQEMGIETVAAYTKVDSDLLHLRYVDDQVCISESSYLDARGLITAAEKYHCDAIHPGYGFFAENAEFAATCTEQGMVFIGPSSSNIATLGDKANARIIAAKYHMQVLPGQAIGSDRTFDEVAAEIGFPLLIKAVHGGGGRGIRLVEHKTELASCVAQAEAEAMANFGKAALYMEKYLPRARHIEVQIIGDGTGNALHLGSRECSIQRKQQKLIEEAPACNLPAEKLHKLQQRSVAMMAGESYCGVATLEFLYQDDEFYFIEVNTRLQVEHTVTECITAVDLVRWQIEVAATSKLPCKQEDIHFNGHAMECRLLAEDHLFNPSPGLITDLIFPGGPGVRVDSHIYHGYKVPHQYDSLIAKIIAQAGSRKAALARMQRALTEFRIAGIETNCVMLEQVLSHTDFIAAGVDTNFLQREFNLPDTHLQGLH